jgi:Ca-activated chloride channel family protein
MTDVRCTLNREYVKANSQAMLFVAVDLVPGQAPAAARQFQSSNIALAIDCSGSMAGEKFEQAVEAACQLVRSLSPSDWISVVSFESKVRVVVPPTQASRAYQVETAIRGIRLGSETDLYGGVERAYEEVCKMAASPATVSRIVMLTDGQPTRGRTKEKDLVALSDQVRQYGITVTSLGIGPDYNDKLLTQMAMAGGGLWHHVSDPYNLPQIFQEEVTEMMRTVVRNPQLSVSLMSNAQFMDIYTVRPMLTRLENVDLSRNTCAIPLRDILVGEEQNLVLRVRFPPSPPGRYPLLRADLGGRTQEVYVTTTDDPLQYGRETNPYPTVLMRASEGTVALQSGLEGNTAALRQAQTVLLAIQADPNAQTVLRSSKTADEAVTRLKEGIDAATTRVLTESERKAIKERTTIRRR